MATLLMSPLARNGIAACTYIYWKPTGVWHACTSPWVRRRKRNKESELNWKKQTRRGFRRNATI